MKYAYQEVRTGEKVGGVHFANDFNSTFFTDCCGVAITDRELHCPRCLMAIWGHEAEPGFERNRVRWARAYRK